MQRPSIRFLVGLACAGSLASALVVAGCADHRLWTPPWEDLGDDDDTMIVDGKAERVMGFHPETNVARSAGCISCHEGTVDPHPNPVNISCVDCHGGDGLATTIEAGHPAARHPDEWLSSANPERTYALLNDESYDWIRFVNPGDLRVLRDTCGRCHGQESLHVQKSLMTNASHFWGVAAYVNGIVSNKSSIFGESYSPEGIAQAVFTVPEPTDEEKARSVIPFIAPLPHFEVGQTGNVFRVFEKGSRLGGAAIGLAGAPLPIVGIPDKLEDPGRPNNRLSDRGLGTLNRVDLPLLNIFKTRLNNPFLSFLGTNDQPGDFRSAGCTACHMVYANDRDPMHSGPYARYGNQGLGNVDEDPWEHRVDADPTIPKDEPGHPLMHRFTRAIPSSQCMVCHHHQPNAFVNSYYGFTMWSYDTDGEPMWPEEQQYPSNHEWYERIMRNPEGAAVTGKWGEPEFLDHSAELNPELKHTQFADYHGHGWMFRGAFKMDRKGNLLDRDGNVVDYDDPDKFRGVIPELGSNPSTDEIEGGAFAPKEGRAVHLRDVHAERGMHCVDCHFERDVHGDGKLYAEYQAAIEITCQDCHGSIVEATDGYTSGPSTGSIRSSTGELKGGAHRTNLLRGETSFRKARFEWERNEAGQDVLRQRSMLYPDLTWVVPQAVDTAKKNPRSAAAKGVRNSHGELAHGDGKMECYACHTSWITACFGCHLPQKANWRTESLHFERKKLRNYATYNPQVVRDAEFMLGVAGNAKGNRIAPVRSSSAVVISSEDGLRRRIYGGVPTIAANGMSSQVFNTHFPHTVRTGETRQCEDCHVSEENDNNAWLAQVFLLGTKQVGYMGYNVFVGEGEEGFEAVRVTEWEEPQAVIGSHLHEMAYPDHYEAFVEDGRLLSEAEHHGGTEILSLQLRGEYLYTANGAGGFRVYDVANVNNKDFSEKLVTSPVSPLGQNTHIETRYATAVALPFNNHISMSRKWRPENQEQPYEYRGRTQNMHELYRYSYVTDLHEGLIVVDTDCLTDFDPQNNFIRRAVTFNPDGILDGAINVNLAGTVAYVCCDRGVVLVDLDDPLEPRVIGTIGAPHVVRPTAVAIQFRYAFVTDSEGLKVLDVTLPEDAKPVAGAALKIAEARDVYVAKSWAYVSAGSRGLVIVDVERPEEPVIAQVFDAGGVIDDLHATRVATTNDTVFAYLADGRNGLRIVKLIAPNDGGRSAFGFSPAPVPELIATHPTRGPAVALSEALDRDRAVDETGNQVAVFGRIGGRPMNLEEMRRLYLVDGRVYAVSNEEDGTTEGDE
ncbi:MAG: hypothetical protein O7B99_03695 [Planctomycetota bacterium]|nr:hypothetical protein [Planctomycetota bacterium]